MNHRAGHLCHRRFKDGWRQAQPGHPFEFPAVRVAGVVVSRSDKLGVLIDYESPVSVGQVVAQVAIAKCRRTAPVPIRADRLAPIGCRHVLDRDALTVPQADSCSRPAGPCPGHVQPVDDRIGRAPR